MNERTAFGKTQVSFERPQLGQGGDSGKADVHRKRFIMGRGLEPRLFLQTSLKERVWDDGFVPQRGE